MNFFEARILQNKRRLERIQSNPDPTKLGRSNAMYYQFEIDDYTALNEAWKAGNPKLSASMDQNDIFGAMGFLNIPYTNAANTSGVMKKNYFDVLRRHGYPDQTCDMVSVPIAMCLEGDLPYPDVVSVWNHACDREGDMMYTAIATEAGCPQFKLDAPLSSDYETVHYMGEQLGELIEFTEAKVPGAKMDWEDLETRVNAEAEIIRLLRRQFELRRKVPCPISGQDVFRGFAGQDNAVKGLEYVRVQTEEVEERAAKGIGSVPGGEEKMRVLWLATGPFGSGVFDMLHKRGVSVPLWQHGFTCNRYGFRDYATFAHATDENEFKSRLTPLEDIARRTIHNQWGGRGLERWIRSAQEIVKFLNIDAVVQFLHVGCVTTGGLATILSDTLEKELGVPVLNIQGRQTDWNAELEREFQKNVNEFIDLCFAKKGIKP